MILVDAGPLAAVVNARDQHHASCAAAFQTIRQPMGTVWPALSEAMYLLAGITNAQEKVWDIIMRGVVQLLPLGPADVPRIRELMQQYANRPMDLADATLIRVAERDGIRQIFTVDRKDFSVYRIHGKIRPTILP